MLVEVKIFFSYAHEDETLLGKLQTFLKPLEFQGVIDGWDDHDLRAGDDWKFKIKEHMGAAQIILLLISLDFLGSAYCYYVEIPLAVEQYEQRGACIIPIILRPVDSLGFRRYHQMLEESQSGKTLTWPLLILLEVSEK